MATQSQFGCRESGEFSYRCTLCFMFSRFIRIFSGIFWSFGRKDFVIKPVPSVTMYLFLYQQMRDACLHAFNTTNWQTLCRYTQSYISCSKCSISTIDFVKIFLILTIILIMSRNVKEHQWQCLYLHRGVHIFRKYEFVNLKKGTINWIFSCQIDAIICYEICSS